MSTYYQVAAIGQEGAGRLYHLGFSARRSFAGLRSFLTSGGVPAKLSQLGVYDSHGERVTTGRDTSRTEITHHATKPHPYLVTSSGWWLGFTGSTERDIEQSAHAPNPGELVTFGANPGKLLGKLHEIRYEHETEGPRKHEFEGVERIELLRDGSIRIYHPDGVGLWTDD